MQKSLDRIQTPSREKQAYNIPTILLLGLLISMGCLHSDPIASSLPGMAQELGCGENGPARVISTFLLGMMFGNLIIGPVSDILGRRKSILCGQVCLLCGAAVCALSPSLPVLIPGRILQGMGGAVSTSTARAVGGDAGEGLRSARILSLMQLVSSTCPIYIPLLGNAVAQAFGWRAVFWLMFAIDGMLLLFTLLLIPDSGRAEKQGAWSQLARDAAAAVKNPAFVLYTLAFGFGISTFYGYTGASSFALQNELGVSAPQYSVMLSCMGVLMVFTAFLSGKLPKFFGLVRTFVGAILLQLLSALAMAVLFSTGRATVLSTVLCYGVIAGCASFTIPIGLSLAVGEAGAIKGTASALCGFVQCLCSWAFTSLLSSVKSGVSIGAAAAVAMAFTTVAALICCYAAGRATRKRA